MGNKNGILSSFMHKLEEKNLSEQEIYSVVINLIINNTLNSSKGYNSTSLFSGAINLEDVELTEDNKIVTKSTVLKARSKNYNREDVIDFINRFGDSDDFISKKKIDNIITAYEIVQNFDWQNRFGRELTEEEKVAIIKSILTNQYMDNKNRVYLTSLIKKMESEGIDEQDTYAIIINLGINGGLKNRYGFDYNSILGGQTKVEDIEFTRDDKTISEMSVLKSRSETLSIEQEKDLIDSLEMLGIQREFLESKDMRNLFVINSIVEGYNWQKSIGRELNEEEKRLIILAMLSNKELNKGISIYIIKELQNLEDMGLTTQEIYATIINFAINSRMNFSYGKFIHGKLNTKSLDLKDDDKKVSELGLLRVKSENLSNEEQEALLQSLTRLGIPINFLENKDIKNVYIINHIIEKYNWQEAIGREISRVEKKLLIQRILANSNFNKNQCNIKWLIRRLEARGLSEQEVYGFILNNNLTNKQNGINITNLINGSVDIENLKFSESDFRISDAMLCIAKSEALNKDEQEELLKYLKKIGVPYEIIRKSKIGNMYLINQMVQEYNWENIFGRNLKDNEKAYVIQNLLNHHTLSYVNISFLIGKLDSKGFNLEEIYGLILNIGINKSINGKKNSNYSNLLNGEIELEEMQFSDNDKKVGLDGALKIKSETMDKDDLINQLQNIGIPNEIIDSANIYDAFIAKEIVEEYDWENNIGRRLNNNEKREIIQLIMLKCSQNKSLLMKLIQKLMLKGLSKQEIYGFILNKGISNYKIEFQNLAISTREYEISKEDTQVTKDLVLRPKPEVITEGEKNELIQSLIELGIPKEFIESRHIHNLYMVNYIVQNYNWQEVLGRSLEDKEKTYIIQKLLNNELLSKKRSCIIGTLIKKLEAKGLNNQEIYGLIINLGINNSLKSEKECCYSNIISGKIEIENLQIIDVDKKLGLDTVLKIESESMNNSDKEELIAYLQGLGISNEFLQNKNIYDVFIAKKIVEAYNWKEAIGRRINGEERRGVMQSILAECNANKPLLIKLIQKLMLKGLDEQEIYGTVINLALKGMLKDKKSYRYKYILQGNLNILRVNLEDEDMTVTEETLKKGIINPESIMKKMLVEAKNNESLSEIPATIEELIRMNKNRELGIT